MRRLLVVLAACSAPTPAPGAVAAPRNPPRDAAIPDAAPVRHATRPVPLPHGPHGAVMTELGALEDGSAAVSLDANGNVRVWPALDGSREPFALPIAAATRTAIAHAGDALAVAALDAAGGLHVLRVTPAGELIERVDTMTEPALRELVATEHGFLAIRGDQAIVRIDGDGRITSTLWPAHGERTVAIVVRHAGALALLETKAGLRGRWIETAGKLGWGETTATFALDPDTAVLSPDHHHIAGRTPEHTASRIYDLDNGTHVQIAGPATPAGFLDDARLGYAASDIGWWGLDGKVIAQPFTDLFDSGGVTCDRGFVLAANRDLMLIDPDTKPVALRYLGYQTDLVLGLAETPVGVVIDTHDGRLVLDNELAGSHSLGLAGTPVDDDQALGLVDNARCPDPASCAAHWLATYDATGKLQATGFDVSGSVRYEPATRLVTAERRGLAVATLLDPATHKLGAAVETPYPDVALLDPALAGGAVALGLRGVGKITVVQRYRALVPALEGDDPVSLPGQVIATDRAGHVYLRQADGTIAISDGTHELGRLGELQRGWVPRPSPDGKLLAAFGDGRILLAATDGTLRWTAGLPDVQDLAWTRDGKLLASAAGVLELDLADGSPRQVRCGWRFALRATPTNPGATTNACDRW